MLWLPLSLFTVSCLLRSTSAQSKVSCLPFYSWASNSHNQSPCDVASSLIAVCNNGSFPIEVLPAMSHYLGPTLQTANPCQCNTVTYSLMSACGACQGRTYLSWSVWSANCPTVSINTYPEPIPSGVAIPGWAYLDVKATDNYDPTLAKENSNLTESTAIPSPTSTRLTSTITIHLSTTSSRASASSTSSSVLTTTTSSSSSSSPEQVRRENAIGGGVVGGLAGLLLILALLFWFIKSRRRLARNGQHLPSPSPTPADPENPTWHEGPYMRQANLTPAPQMSPAVSDVSATSVLIGTKSRITDCRIVPF
ncbi:hypothetical protein CPC08DRAFT_391330 [Agrocybe pediades]|nr:hypothetical protein CPC08DRAFT_391330 [Agrocybe pediades]